MNDMNTYLLNGEGNDTTPPQDSSTPQQAQGDSQEAQQAMNKDNNTGNTQPLRHKYTSYSLGEFLADLTPLEYLIDNWIQCEGLHVIFGESGSYKSFNVIDMCGRIACNDFDTWCGKKVEHGGVFYLAGEGVHGLKKRFAGWCLEHGKNPKDIPIHISPEAFTLDDKTPEHNIDSTIANIRAVCPNVKLVAIDTLNRYMSGEENSATDMGAFVFACSKLQRELGCAVLIVHHSGLAQEAKGRARGSGALYNALDIEIQCVKSGMTCTLTQTKNKEAEKDKPVSFDMKEIEIPGIRNKKGFLVRTTTLVPIFNETQTEALATAEPEKQRGKNHSKAFTRGIKTFKEAAIRHGRLTTNEATGESFIDVAFEEWREVAYEIIDVPNEKTGNYTNDKDTQKQREKKRSAFNRMRATLIENEPPIITHYEKEGTTYYRLSHNGEAEPTFRIETFAAVRRRIEEEKKSATTNNDDAGGGEMDATGNLFETPSEK